MKVKTITYSKVFPLGSYVNEKVGVEVEIDENEDWDEAFKGAKALVNEWGQKPVEFNVESHIFGIPNGQTSLPQYPSITAPIPTKDISEDKLFSVFDVELIIGEIEMMSRKSDVERYRYVAQQYPEIQKAYLNKLKQFV